MRTQANLERGEVSFLAMEISAQPIESMDWTRQLR